MSRNDSPNRQARNKEIVDRIFTEAWNNRQIDAIAPHIAPHTAFHFRGQTIHTGPDELQALIVAWHRAFTNLHFQVHDLLAEGERVAVRLTFSGIHSGEWKGIAPTGRPVAVTEMMFFRFEDGQVVEAWEDYDEYGLHQQLGALP